MEELIYHYTSMECFLNMLDTFEKNGSKEFEFWASSIFYMNDSSEFYHGYDVLMENYLPNIEDEMRLPENMRVSQIWKVAKTREKEVEFQKKFINNLMLNNETPFIVSFSKSKDAPMLWDRYGDKGRGVCLVFKEYDCKIIPALKPKDMDVEIDRHISVCDVSYDDSLDESCMKVLPKTYQKYSEEAKEKTDEIELFRLKLTYLSSFVNVFAPFIKTKDFAFEKEIRLIEHVPEGEHVSYRCAKDGTLIPFLKIKVPVKAFKAVYVGSASRVELNVKALQSRFRHNEALADKCVCPSVLSKDLF